MENGIFFYIDWRYIAVMAIGVLIGALLMTALRLTFRRRRRDDDDTPED